LQKLTDPDRFHEKARKHFLTKDLQKHRKIKDSVSHYIFETDLEKIEPKKHKHFMQKKKKKKTFRKAILPVLTASP